MCFILFWGGHVYYFLHVSLVAWLNQCCGLPFFRPFIQSNIATVPATRRAPCSSTKFFVFFGNVYHFRTYRTAELILPFPFYLCRPFTRSNTATVPATRRASCSSTKKTKKIGHVYHFRTYRTAELVLLFPFYLCRPFTRSNTATVPATRRASCSSTLFLFLFRVCIPLSYLSHS